MSIEARVNKLGLNGLIEDSIHVHSGRRQKVDHGGDEAC